MFELIKENSSNEDYVVGDALLELFPIDFIKPSELGGASVRICCEENAQLDYDIINAIKGVEELISENKIKFSNKSARKIICSNGLMLLRTDPEHFDRLIVVPTASPSIWDVVSSHYSICEC